MARWQAVAEPRAHGDADPQPDADRDAEAASEAGSVSGPRLLVPTGHVGPGTSAGPVGRPAASPVLAATLPRVRTGPRVGVAGPGGDAAAYPWRFWLDGEPSVSAYRPAKPRRRRAEA